MKKQPLFWITLPATLVLFWVMGVVDKPLQNPVAPQGIISFELADGLQQSLQILDSWDAEARVFAGLSLGIDYLFMLSYGLLFMLIILLLADRLPQGILKKTAPWLAGAVLLAAVLDGIENYGLIRLLTGHHSEAMSSLAYWCASVKFALLGAGLLFVVIVLAALGLARLRKT